jgi:DNA invertase Pin-like site-specific DNA recombinase
MGKKRRASVIAYYRVSTRKQGDSGLGLDAQRKAVHDYAASIKSPILAEYTEVESGKHSARPELAKAIARARRAKGRLVVAKLDRLARNVAFTSALMESKVDFVACDNPHANKLTIHLLAAMAEHEAEQISKRTKDALAAAKAKGVKLGSHRPGHWASSARRARRLEGALKGTKVAAVVRRKAAIEAYADLLPLMRQLRDEGLSFDRIADRLNEEGHTTRQGKHWHRSQVKVVLDRAEG